MTALQLCNEFLRLPQRIEHHRKGLEVNCRAARRSVAPERPGNATISASVHFPTRPVAPQRSLKSTKFYYPAKIFELLSIAAMTTIRISAFHPARHAARVAAAVRVRAPQ
jgi:hypothetical protein